MQLGVLFGSQLLGGGLFMKMAVMGASIAGSLLLKDKSKPNPNKLNDLRVSSSTFGRGIPLVYGTFRVTGNMFWATEFREDRYFMTQKGKRVEGKKGEKKEKKGKAQEMFDYYANFAMGLAEGPVDSLIRVWADNNLIFNKLNPNDEDIVEIGFTQEQGRGKTGNKSSAGKGKGRAGASGRFVFRFYKGSEEQLPDSFMAAKTGVNKSPGYRGLCYLFFEDFALKDFGNRTPTITAEISVVEQRRPAIEWLLNMEPKTGFSQKVGGPVHFCPVRNRLYHKAIGPIYDAETDTVLTGRHMIRVFDIQKRKEIKRIDLTAANKPGSWIGMSHLGDFVWNRETQNVSPVDFYDPDTMQRKASWGRSGIGLGLGPIDGVFGARFAVPLMGTDPVYMPVGHTAIHSWDGIHTFNDQYGLTSFITSHNTPGLGISRPLKRLQAGQPNSETQTGHPAGAFAISQNIYAHTERVFAFSPDEPRMWDESDLEEIFKWPPMDWLETVTDWYDWQDDQPGFQYGSIDWAGAVIGAKAVGIICTWSNHGTWAFKLDYQTGEEVWRKQISTDSVGPSGGFMSPNIASTNQLSWFTGRTVYTVDWRQNIASSIQVGATPGDGNRIYLPREDYGEYYWAAKDAIIYFSNDSQIENGEGVWIICYLDRKMQNKVHVSDICRDIAERCRIPSERIDTSGMTEDEEVTGYSIESPTPGRAVLEELAEVFQFDAVESDNIVKFVSRGKNVIATITQDDLGVVETDFGGENEYYAETRLQEVDLPERCVVEYIDPTQKVKGEAGSAYEVGNQSYKRPLRPISVMGSADRLDVTLNMAMTPLRAKTLAQRILFAAWGERTQHQYTLGQDYLRLDPSDVIRVNLNNGESFIDRITDIEIGADYSMHLNTVSQVADHYSFITTVGEPGGVILLPYTPPPNAKAGVYDVPYLFDVDANNEANAYEFYWSAKAYDNGFGGGILSSRLMDSDDEETEGFTKFDCVWGTLTAPLPAPPDGITEITDTETVITVIPAYDFNEVEVRYVWESISDEDWPNTVNMMIVGDEVILFKNAEEITGGRVQLSHLIRGYRGSGIAAFNHPPASGFVSGTGTAYGAVEEFCIVTNLSVHDADHLIETVNKERKYMVATGSMVPAWFAPVRKITTAASRKPLQVGGLKRTNSGSNTTISFARSTRVGGGGLTDGTSSVPLNEAFMKFECYVLHNPYDKATWDPENTALWWKKVELEDVQTFTITGAEFSTAGKVNTQDLHVVIYQMSDQVGYGFPRYATLPYSMFGL